MYNLQIIRCIYIFAKIRKKLLCNTLLANIPFTIRYYGKCLPLNSSIQDWTLSGGLVSLMCFSASSSSTSPVGDGFFNKTFYELIPLCDDAE
jgi:hypothetical protein